MGVIPLLVLAGVGEAAQPYFGPDACVPGTPARGIGAGHSAAADRLEIELLDTDRLLRRLARQGPGRALLLALAVVDDLADGSLVVDPAAPDVAGPIEIVAVHQPDAGPEVHRFLRRAVDHALNARASAPATLESSL